eukprot:2421611-Alexandrium_andersonii.AAC.1
MAQVQLRRDPFYSLGLRDRSGMGKVRHLAVSQLRTQECQREGPLTFFRRRGDFNPVDLLAKF